MDWQPIETAPVAGVIQLACDAGKERRTFAAERSFDSEREEWVWMTTTGWTGWTRLHPAWRPYAWRPLEKPPEATA